MMGINNIGLLSSTGGDIPEEMTLFYLYPDGSIMTNEAVHGMVDQKIVVRVGNDVYRGRITQAINYPERNGYTVRISEIQRDVY